MPLYEFLCPQCGKFETMKAMEQRHRARCPHCNSESKLLMSGFSFKFYNPFTKDGEGFTSTTYPRDEYKRRVATNAGKGDVYHKDFE